MTAKNQDMMVGPPEPFVLNNCSNCRGHRWKMWTRVTKQGSHIPEVRACLYCNPEGKRKPPVFVDERPKHQADGCAEEPKND